MSGALPPLPHIPIACTGATLPNPILEWTYCRLQITVGLHEDIWACKTLQITVGLHEDIWAYKTLQVTVGLHEDIWACKTLLVHISMEWTIVWERKGGTSKWPTPLPPKLACTLREGGMCSTCGERHVGEIERHQPSRYPSSHNPVLPNCKSRILIEMLWGR
jgi:hypothetical protein